MKTAREQENMSNATKPSAEALAAANHIWDATPAGDGTSFIQHWTPDRLAHIIDSHFAELRRAALDAHDFIHALRDATAGANQIDKDSILRCGERLKTTAAKLDAKLAKALGCQRCDLDPNRQ